MGVGSMLGPLIFVVWLTVLIASLVIVAVHAVRHGARRIGRTLLCPLGAILMLGFYAGFVGVAERVLTVRGPALWVCLALGVAGVILVVLGIQSALKPRTRPGECTNCGYDLVGLSATGEGTCPECGAPPQPK